MERWLAGMLVAGVIAGSAAWFFAGQRHTEDRRSTSGASSSSRNSSLPASDSRPLPATRSSSESAPHETNNRESPLHQTGELEKDRDHLQALEKSIVAQKLVVQRKQNELGRLTREKLAMENPGQQAFFQTPLDSSDTPVDSSGEKSVNTVEDYVQVKESLEHEQASLREMYVKLIEDQENLGISPR